MKTYGMAMTVVSGKLALKERNSSNELFESEVVSEERFNCPTEVGEAFISEDVFKDLHAVLHAKARISTQ